MELKIQINDLTIKDENTGEKYTIKTVRSVKDIYEALEQEEKEALSDKIYDLAGQY